MKKFIAIVFSLAVLASCAVEKQLPANVNVRPVAALSNATSGVLVYSLPATAVRVNVTVEKTINKVGPFFRYSQKMLNVTDVVTEDKEEWRIKCVDIETYGVPDMEKRYAISFEGPSVAPFLNLSTDGILQGVNLNGIVVEPQLKKQGATVLPGLADVNFNDVPMLEKQLLKTSTAAMAEEAANFIYKVRKRRVKILASDFEQLPPDGQSYEVMVRELNALEQDYLELFIGKKETHTMTRSFDLLPNAMSANEDVLFRFSSVKGIVDKMDLSGAPVYVSFASGEAKKLPAAAITAKDAPRQGLYYCQPGKVTIKIIDKNVLIKEQEVLLGQYGQVVSMPASVLDRNDVSIRLDGKTGALEAIERK